MLPKIDCLIILVKINTVTDPKVVPRHHGEINPRPQNGRMWSLPPHNEDLPNITHKYNYMNMVLEIG